MVYSCEGYGMYGTIDYAEKRHRWVDDRQMERIFIGTSGGDFGNVEKNASPRRKNATVETTTTCFKKCK